ncbi:MULTISPECIES: CsgG/HfaB family protein [unclassified Rhizobium]|uniref:CsgG/HfaB family protein n=1 Tax=unclassified Rhizobium TaxID=2613769 RepID=UPI001610C17B|nr:MULTISPECIES: CsgG/HfaB family protein [unclassified Rhizobium]MBB3320085.1 curli production assembly/transport component CsgG [Rhizobium sp. BK181]MCS3744073.1 curli production assembly/transport component CsgG [Rhizobium sp. BK661]
MKVQAVSLLLSSILLAGCQTGQHLNTPAAALTSATKTTAKVVTLPLPETPVDVAVYDFPDLTGQAKPNDSFAEYSRAVTQGGGSILIDVLKKTGNGQWFRVVERSGLKNLVQERTLIENTQKSYRQPVGLPPVRFAGLILEGGIVGYDSNELTGGAGARYLGIGGDVQYRSDVVTVSLRAVSVQTGEVLASTTTTKQIYSVQVRGSAYKFATANELLEVELGQARNDPGALAVREGIELAVVSLAVDGVRQGLWHLRDRSQEAQFLAEFEKKYLDRPLSSS